MTKTSLPQKLDEEALPEIEKILGVESENTGGNVMCFVFYGEKNGKKGDLYFGWANGNLGFSITHDGYELASGELAEGKNAEAQAAFIRATCERHGYNLDRQKVAPRIVSAKFHDEEKSTITHDELIAVDNILLKHVATLRELGANDLAALRIDLRKRVLKILDAALQVR